MFISSLDDYVEKNNDKKYKHVSSAKEYACARAKEATTTAHGLC